ncbi:hypothetical protein Pcinc_012676 [Petrolisthes cinctipes]|uniref:OCEL domain-containing protein n=1 Tax=Petrolisthes cinctipes TaxID=88211 RepID=A0AAE1FA31_PETCI|nr:hypothetical protein Pcinc_024363 [Petrolisthes cinctipes]KAK3882975.1 hypothetical protein Pcinc_012676 [Petrolisthes cinctipes]
MLCLHVFEILIPAGRSNGTSKFSFFLQNIQEGDGPKGSFEFIKQFGTRALESLGPMVAKVFIQAKDDSYEKTKNRMKDVNIKNQMNCVKEVKADYSTFRRSNAKKSPMVIPPPKKEVVAELPSNNKFSPNSPHRTQQQAGGNIPSSGKPVPPPPPSRGGYKNPELMRRPLRERIIQMLAVKNYRKPEIMGRLYNDGILEKDRRLMTSVLNSVSQVKENIHHLSRHLWTEVREDWPFYTDKEKDAVRRLKPQSTPPNNESSSHSPTSSQPLSPAEPQGTKRANEETIDPTAKRPRWSQRVVSKPTRRNNNNTSSVKGETVSSLHPDSRLSSKPKTTNNSSLDSRHRDEPVLTNGTSSPARKPFSASPLAHGSPRHRLNGIHSNHHASGNHSPINGMTNGLTNGHGNPHHKTNGHIKSEPTTPSSSPDNHSKGEKVEPSYLKNYCNIDSVETRSQYKADFNKQYEEYLRLHNFIEEHMKQFTELEERLKSETQGSEEYNTIRAQMIKKYEATQQDCNYQQKKKRYNYLFEKLAHIKKLVREYDAAHS